eukprot:187315-Pyramimonas_sp.AAC.1
MGRDFPPCTAEQVLCKAALLKKLQKTQVRRVCRKPSAFAAILKGQRMASLAHSARCIPGFA